MERASETVVQSNVDASLRMQQMVQEERRQAAEDRQRLLAQIAGLVNAQAERQETRLASKTELLQADLLRSNETFSGSLATYSNGMDAHSATGDRLASDVAKSRDVLKTKLKDDWTVSFPPASRGR